MFLLGGHKVKKLILALVFSPLFSIGASAQVRLLVREFRCHGFDYKIKVDDSFNVLYTTYVGIHVLPGRDTGYGKYWFERRDPNGDAVFRVNETTIFLDQDLIASLYKSHRPGEIMKGSMRELKTVYGRRGVGRPMISDLTFTNCVALSN